jgi:hypothetical protein
MSLVVWVGATILGMRPILGLEHLMAP